MRFEQGQAGRLVDSPTLLSTIVNCFILILTPVPGLPQPDGKAAVVLVGRGTQNYTCNGVAPTAAPKANGALANLYDISCLMEADPTWTLYREVPKAALQLAAEHVDSREPLKLYDGAITMDLLGHHYFNDTSATTPTPVFDFHVSGDGFIAGKLEERKSIDAPANAIKGVDARGFGSVPWVQVPKRFDAEGKKAFNELWRVETAGGSPPKTCEAFPEGGEFTVEYAANYWYFD